MICPRSTYFCRITPATGAVITESFILSWARSRAVAACTSLLRATARSSSVSSWVSLAITSLLKSCWRRSKFFSASLSSARAMSRSAWAWAWAARSSTWSSWAMSAPSSMRSPTSMGSLVTFPLALDLSSMRSMGRTSPLAETAKRKGPRSTVTSL